MHPLDLPTTRVPASAPRRELRAWIGLIAIAIVLAIAVATGMASDAADAVGQAPSHGSFDGR